VSAAQRRPPAESGRTSPSGASALEHSAVPIWFSVTVLGVLAFCMAPAVTWLPTPLIIQIAGLLLLRLYALHLGLRRLSMPLLVATAAAALITLALFAPPLLSREGSSAALLTLSALKAMEGWRRRDAHLLLLIGCFMTLNTVVMHPGPGLAYGLISLLALVTTLRLSFTHTERTPAGTFPAPDLHSAARLTLFAGGRLLLALPLALTCYLVLPRTGPMARLPWGTQDAPRSGLSDNVRPGSISHLAQDHSEAFRVTFDGPVPRPEERYFRALVLNTYDGSGWNSTGTYPPSPPLFTGTLRTYHLDLPGGFGPWIPVLGTVTVPPSDTALSPADELIDLAPTLARRGLDLQVTEAAVSGLQASRGELALNLVLPAGHNPATRALAATWKQAPDTARVEQALTFFRQDHLTYTLDPPLLQGDDQVDDLLYRTRQGFCEHFASSFVYLMRASGVPARLVVGYQGGTPTEGGAPNGHTTLSVRNSDAHAWAEVWLTGRGWQRIDPTAVVSPQRLERQVALPLAGGASMFARPLQRLWQRITHLPLTPAALALGTLTLVLGTAGIGLTLGRRRSTRPGTSGDWETARLYTALTDRLDVPPLPGESPSTYASRVGLASPDQAQRIQTLTRRYLDLRYGPGSEQISAESVRRLRRDISGLNAVPGRTNRTTRRRRAG